MTGQPSCDEILSLIDEAAAAEVMLAVLVRDWVARVLPGEPVAAERAAGRVAESLAAGASVSEAWRDARSFVACWSRHPSGRQPGRCPFWLAS